MNPSYHLHDSIIHPQPITPKPTTRPRNNPSNHHRHTKEAHPLRPQTKRSKARTPHQTSHFHENVQPRAEKCYYKSREEEQAHKRFVACPENRMLKKKRRKKGRKEGRKGRGVSRSIMHMREPRWRLERRPVFRKRRVYR
jgi:hypothetical protein